MQLTPVQHLFAIGLVLLDLVARGLRIRQMLPVSVMRAMAINTCGDALAAVTPARVGGEPVRYVGFREAGAPAAGVLAAFATEVCVDVVVLGTITLVLALWLAPEAAGRVAALASSPWGWAPRSLGLALLGVLAVVVLWRRAVVPAKLGAVVREACEITKNRSSATLGSVAGLTLVSVAARTAILPVLAAAVPGSSLGGLVAGSFALVFGQGVLPIPGGLGAVDLGFALGFSPFLSAAALAKLLLVWRFYSLALGALLGAGLLAWTAVSRSRMRAPAEAPLEA